MSRRHARRRLVPAPPRRKKALPSVTVRFDLQGLLSDAQYAEQARRYLWDYDSALAFQRTSKADQIKAALLEAAEGPFEFSGWQRVVRYKYSLNPLSPAGSLVGAGGRFNYSDFNPQQFSPFPALYAAQKRETALAEALGQPQESSGGLSPLELALAGTSSISVVSTRGRLDLVIDLRHPERLQPFVDAIKDFEIPEHVLHQAKEIGQPKPTVITTVEQLVAALIEPNWRWLPMLGDVPASCQNFGDIVRRAGIDGIVYPSKIDGEPCVAMFPGNFKESFVELVDSPPSGIVATRLDASTRALILGTPGSGAPGQA